MYMWQLVIRCTWCKLQRQKTDKMNVYNKCTVLLKIRISAPAIPKLYTKPMLVGITLTHKGTWWFVAGFHFANIHSWTNVIMLNLYGDRQLHLQFWISAVVLKRHSTEFIWRWRGAWKLTNYYSYPLARCLHSLRNMHRP